MNVAEVVMPKKMTESKANKSNKENKENKENIDESAKSISESRKHNSEDGEYSFLPEDALVGDIPMTVIEVLDNGNLFIAGGKMVSVNFDDKYVRITGVVDPANLIGGKVIPSSMVSEVQIHVDDLRIYSDGTAIKFSEGQAIYGSSFHSTRAR